MGRGKLGCMEQVRLYSDGNGELLKNFKQVSDRIRFEFQKDSSSALIKRVNLEGARIKAGKPLKPIAVGLKRRRRSLEILKGGTHEGLSDCG